MVQPFKHPDAVGNKPFNFWHRRRLSEDCWMTDLDCIESREGRGVVAIIETKGRHGRLSFHQKMVFTEMSEKLGVPFYYVKYHTDDEMKPPEEQKIERVLVIKITRKEKEKPDGEIEFNEDYYREGGWIDEEEFILFMEGL